MSDYLGILARRAISAPALRPRPRSRFEDGPGVEAAQAEQPVPDYLPAVSPAPAAPVAPQAAPPDRPAAQAPVAQAVPYPAMPAAVTAPLAAPAPPVRAPRAEPAPATIGIEAPAQPAAVVPLAVAGVVAVRADTTRVREALPPVLSAIAPLPPLQNQAPRDQRPALETVTRLMINAPLAAAAPARDAGQGGRQLAAAAEAPPPAIEIHIGRIEVHAAGEPAPRAPAPQPVQAPATASLDDYLRERNGRGGRS